MGRAAGYLASESWHVRLICLTDSLRHVYGEISPRKRDASVRRFREVHILRDIPWSHRVTIEMSLFLDAISCNGSALV